MKLTAFIMSLFVAGIGAVGTVSPAKIVSFARKFEGRTGLLKAAAFRIAFGTALLHSAKSSRLPSAVRNLGTFTMAAGAATPFVGPRRFRRVLRWWTKQSPIVSRSWSAVALGFGVFLAWTVAPWRR